MYKFHEKNFLLMYLCPGAMFNILLHPFQNISRFEHIAQIKKYNYCCMRKRNYELIYKIVIQ
jgi:hypothetical protein